MRLSRQRRNVVTALAASALIMPIFGGTLLAEEELDLDSQAIVTPREEVAAQTGYLLYHDSGMPQGFYDLYYPRGHLVRFSPPSKEFTIQMLMVCGNYEYKGKKALGPSTEKRFTVKIWNEDFSEELWSQDLSWYLFPKSPKYTWVKVDVPGIKVKGDFCIDVITNNPDPPDPEGPVLGIAWSNSTLNEHSSVSLYGTEDTWVLPMPREDVNWMVRVKGLS
jgi:hypothetical protein